MTTTTFLVDGTPMPLGVDDLLEYLGQYGHAWLHPQNLCILLSGGPMKRGNILLLGAYLSLTKTHQLAGKTVIWSDGPTMTYDDLTVAINAFLDAKEQLLCKQEDIQ